MSAKIEEKDPRTFKWTVDTLVYPGSFQTSMREMWGSSPSDVYAVGHNDRAYGKMYHFDGRNWTPINTPFGGIDLTAIYGFAYDDIWAVGEHDYSNPNPPPNFLDSSLIIHFDGSQWREHRVAGGRLLQSIWGANANDVWAAGWNGTLLHYEGSRWSKVPAKTDYSFFDVTGKGSAEVYMLGSRYDGPTGDLTSGYRVLFRFDGTTWYPTDSVHVSSDRFFRIAMVGSTLYSLGYGVWAWRDGAWQKELTTNAVLQGIHAVNTSNIYVVGQQSLVYHYDGSSWTKLENTVGEGWWLRAVWATEQEAIIVGFDAGGNKTIIVHGK